MLPEAVIICVDNSDYSKNGDFQPNRLASQQEAGTLIARHKLQANAENSVGLLRSAGENVCVKLSFTNDINVFNSSICQLKSSGNFDIIKSLKIAQLALKNRVNRKQAQRIILLVGSPVECQEDEIKSVVKILKKNNIAVDIINFAEVSRNRLLLNLLHNGVNSNNSSNYFEIIDSTSIVDKLADSGILGNVTSLDDLEAIDDPDLYMALRLSLEEERARGVRENHALNTNENLNDIVADTNADVKIDSNVPTLEEINSMNIDEDLRQALILSLKDTNEDFDSKDADNKVINTESEKEKNEVKKSEENHALNSETTDFFSQILPEVDLKDPEIQKVLKELGKRQE